MTTEAKRLEETREGNKNWKKWGPYLAERQWGTVREDYSSNGDAWNYLPHDHARSQAYRWGEDGIAGISDEQQTLCFSLALWNGKDPIIKERLFGLTGPEGNHGEDVKEHYYYLDSTPTHSYMKMLYKYPQQAFPYSKLVKENRKRGKYDPEFELIDTGVFDKRRYFDVFVTYAKADADDVLIEITIHNRGKNKAELHVLPTLLFRNTWAWGYDAYKPRLSAQSVSSIKVDHRDLPEMSLFFDGKPDDVLFCENETNTGRLYGDESSNPYPKDGIHTHIIDGENSVNPDLEGTKASVHYTVVLKGGEATTFRLRLGPESIEAPFADFDQIVGERKDEADHFFKQLYPHTAETDAQLVFRQAIAGMMWTKQFYYFDIPQWLEGDPVFPEPDEFRRYGRNSHWIHLNNADIISMPDKWEYPWYAAWDLAFHCVTLALVDIDFAKQQLILLTKEWYMHPNGQLPAYEWNFSDVNPPVHAWATWKIYQMEKEKNGVGDRDFLEEVFHKLLLNFTWWVNRKDQNDNNIFEGGFLGLDNIGVFDRSSELPHGGHLEQADGTSWMAMFSLNLMRMSLELALENDVYENLATKFFEHFLYIAGAMVNVGNQGISLWDEEDEFFYDVLKFPNGDPHRLKVRSMVGLSPLFAVEVLDDEILEANPDFARRLDWFLNYRPDLAGLVSRWQEFGKRDTHLLSLLRGHRMKCLLKRMLDETEFLSDYGIRALSKYHETHPYEFSIHGEVSRVAYTPAESDSNMFGGNSNWRGPIWFPVNYLLIDSLRNFHRYYGDDFVVEYPVGSDTYLSLREIATKLIERLTRLFLSDNGGKRAIFGNHEIFQTDPHFKDYLLFYEYFHGDNGTGLGASHQTGWTGLIANLLLELKQ